MGNDTTKPVAEMSDEEVLRECCGPCHHCKGSGDGGPIGKKIAAALGYDDSKCPYCNGKGHVCEMSPARIRALVAAERRDEFDRTCKIIAAERIKRLEMSTRNDQDYLEGLSDGFDGAIAAIRERGGEDLTDASK